MKLVFAGTPEVAVPALDALIASGRHEVAAVVTRPDAPAGRGRRLVASPVAQRAEEAGHRGAQARQAAGRGRSSRGCGRSRPTAVPSSPTARCCPESPSTSPPTAGSTCTSRCCPPGAAPRPCSTRSWPATRSPAPPPSSSRRAWTPGPVYGMVTEEVRPTDTSGDLLTRLAFAGAGLLAATMDGIEDGTLQGRTAARRRRHPRAEDHRRGRPGRLVRARPPGRPDRARLHARARRLDRVPRRAAQARSRSRPCPSAPISPPASSSVGKNNVYVGTGSHAVELLWVQAAGQEADARRRLGPRRADRRRRACSAPEPFSRPAVPVPVPRDPAGPHDVRWKPHPFHRIRSTFLVSEQPRRPQKPGKPYRRPQKDPVRILAFEALRAVDERDAYANLVLPPLLRKARAKGDFDGRDAALATELVYGTLRRQGTYDASSRACVDRPLREVDPPVLDVLSLGAHQLLGTRIPTHAAVSATVELARVVLGDGRAKFVNAVLRKVAAARSRRLDRAGRAALRRGPRGPSRRRALASPLGRLRAVGLARRRPRRASRSCSPPTTSGPRSPWSPGPAAPPPRSCSTPEEAAVPGRWSPYAVRLAEGGEPGAIDAVRDGRAGVQDEGSQLVALALANAPLDGPDRRWLDGCAGPGGKAALLAALAARAGRAAARLREAAAPGRAGRAGRCTATRARTRSSPPTAPGRRGGPAPSTGC